jgi:hypothetical protein
LRIGGACVACGGDERIASFVTGRRSCPRLAQALTGFQHAGGNAARLFRSRCGDAAVGLGSRRNTGQHQR